MSARPRRPSILFATLFGALAFLGTANAAVLSVEFISTTVKGGPANNWCDQPAISGNGRFVAFRTFSDNLVPGDTNNAFDIFLRDRQGVTFERISVSGAEAQANGESSQPSISSDGRYVAFVSAASNLVAGDTNNLPDIFVRDRQLGQTQRVSLRSDGSQVPANFGEPHHAAISGNGRVVAMQHSADLTGPGFAGPGSGGGTYIRDLDANVTERVAFKSNGGEAVRGNSCAISDDGRFVAFDSFELEMFPEDTTASLDIFVRDRQLDSTEWVTRGIAALPMAGNSMNPTISADGQFVAFQSDRSDLVPSASNGDSHIYLHDRQTEQMERISVGTNGATGNLGSGDPSPISSDGRYVAFSSYASNLVPGDTNGSPDIFLRDRQQDTTERVNLRATGEQAPQGSQVPAMSGDARVVAFEATLVFIGEPLNVGQIFAVVLGDEPVNRAPVANAPSDQTVKTKAARAKVVLDGSGSSDPDEDKLTYIWRDGKTQIATGVKPTVRLKKGIHTITLEVRDPGGLSDTDEVVITVKKKKRR